MIFSTICNNTFIVSSVSMKLIIGGSIWIYLFEMLLDGISIISELLIYTEDSDNKAGMIHPISIGRKSPPFVELVVSIHCKNISRGQTLI